MRNNGNDKDGTVIVKLLSNMEAERQATLTGQPDEVKVVGADARTGLHDPIGLWGDGT